VQRAGLEELALLGPSRHWLQAGPALVALAALEASASALVSVAVVVAAAVVVVVAGLEQVAGPMAAQPAPAPQIWRLLRAASPCSPTG
jgi:hypothetical protein